MAHVAPPAEASRESASGMPARPTAADRASRGRRAAPVRRRRPRPGRVVVAGLVIAVMLAAVAIIWGLAWAWVPAVLAAILFVVVIAMDRLDRRVRHEQPLPEMPEPRREQVTRTEAWTVGTETTFIILGGLAAIALVLASVFLEWPLVALGGLLVFAWCVLLGMPVWLAAVGDEEEVERERLAGEPVAPSLRAEPDEEATEGAASASPR